MIKISKSHAAKIVALLKNWKHPPLNWERVKKQISATILDGENSWTRQSLKENADIDAAWKAAKKRLSGGNSRSRNHLPEKPSESEELQEKLTKLQAKYDALLLRHRQLAYNASMLPGGTRLLLDPLPDNTPVQKEGIGGRQKR